MAVGLGLGIGTVNTVSALAEEGAAERLSRRRKVRRAPAVTRRTTLTFDSAGSARVGLIPRHGRAVTELADLARRGVVAARVRVAVSSRPACAIASWGPRIWWRWSPTA